MKKLIGKGTEEILRNDGTKKYRAFAEYRKSFLGVTYKSKHYLQEGYVGFYYLQTKNDWYSICEYDSELEAVVALEAKLEIEEKSKIRHEGEKVKEVKTKYYWP